MSKSHRQIGRLLAPILILGLALPGPALSAGQEEPAHSLRVQQSPKTRAGLEEALTSGNPDDAIQAVARNLSGLLTQPPGAGLEENDPLELAAISLRGKYYSSGFVERGLNPVARAVYELLAPLKDAEDRPHPIAWTLYGLTNNAFSHVEPPFSDTATVTLSLAPSLPFDHPNLAGQKGWLLIRYQDESPHPWKIDVVNAVTKTGPKGSSRAPAGGHHGTMLPLILGFVKETGGWLRVRAMGPDRSRREYLFWGETVDRRDLEDAGRDRVGTEIVVGYPLQPTEESLEAIARRIRGQLSSTGLEEETEEALSQILLNRARRDEWLDAAWELAERGTSSSRDHLKRALQEPAETVREAVLHALGGAANSADHQLLLGVFQTDPSSMVRMQAAVALAMLHHQQPEQVEEALAAMREQRGVLLHSPEEDIWLGKRYRQKFLWAMGHLESQAQRLQWQPILLSGSSSRQQRLEAAGHLGDLNDARCVDALIAAFGQHDGDPEVQSAVLNALLQYSIHPVQDPQEDQEEGFSQLMLLGHLWPFRERAKVFIMEIAFERRPAEPSVRQVAERHWDFIFKLMMSKVRRITEVDDDANAGLEESEVDRLFYAGIPGGRARLERIARNGWTVDRLRELERLNRQFSEFFRERYGLPNLPRMLFHGEELSPHSLFAHTNHGGRSIINLDPSRISHAYSERGINRWFWEEWVHTLQGRVRGTRFGPFPALPPAGCNEFFQALKNGFRCPEDERFSLPPFDLEPFLQAPRSPDRVASFDVEVAQEVMEIHAAALGWVLALSWLPREPTDPSRRAQAFWEATVRTDGDFFDAVRVQGRWGAVETGKPLLARLAAEMEAILEVDAQRPFLSADLKGSARRLLEKYRKQAEELRFFPGPDFAALKEAYKSYFFATLGPFRETLQAEIASHPPGGGSLTGLEENDPLELAAISLRGKYYSSGFVERGLNPVARAVYELLAPLKDAEDRPHPIAWTLYGLTNNAFSHVEPPFSDTATVTLSLAPSLPFDHPNLAGQKGWLLIRYQDESPHPWKIDVVNAVTKTGPKGSSRAPAGGHHGTMLPLILGFVKETGGWLRVRAMGPDRSRREYLFWGETVERRDLEDAGRDRVGTEIVVGYPLQPTEEPLETVARRIRGQLSSAGMEEQAGKKKDEGGSSRVGNLLSKLGELTERWDELTLHQRFQLVKMLKSLESRFGQGTPEYEVYNGGLAVIEVKLQELNPAGWTELVRGDVKTTVPALEISSVTRLDRRAVGAAYLFSRKPALAQVKGLLDSREQEFGVNAILADGRPRVAAVVGAEHSVGYGEFLNDLYKMWDRVAVRISLHNHPRRTGFPSRGDFEHLEENLEKWPDAVRGQRNFTYESGSFGRGIFEYGVKEGEPTPGRIQVRTWRPVPLLGKEDPAAPDEVEYLEKTFGWHLAEIANPPRRYIYTPPLETLLERLNPLEALRIEVTDGKRWVAWDSRVTLESLLADFVRRPARRGRPAAGLEEPLEIRLDEGAIRRLERLSEALKAHWRALGVDPLDPKTFQSGFAESPGSFSHWLELLTTVAVRISTMKGSRSESDRTFLTASFSRDRGPDPDLVGRYFTVRDTEDPRGSPWADLRVDNLADAVRSLTKGEPPDLRNRARVRAMAHNGFLHLQMSFHTLQELSGQLPVMLAIVAFFLPDPVDLTPSLAGLEERVVTLEQIRRAASWREIFGNDRPVVWEVGFGSWEMIAKRARESPEMNFLGIELPYVQDDMLADRRFNPNGLPPNLKFIFEDVRRVAEALPDELRSLRGILIDHAVTSASPDLDSYIFHPPGALSDLADTLGPDGEFVLRASPGFPEQRFRDAIVEDGALFQQIQEEESHLPPAALRSLRPYLPAPLFIFRRGSPEHLTVPSAGLEEKGDSVALSPVRTWSFEGTSPDGADTWFRIPWAFISVPDPSRQESLFGLMHSDSPKSPLRELNWFAVGDAGQDPSARITILPLVEDTGFPMSLELAEGVFTSEGGPGVVLSDGASFQYFDISRPAAPRDGIYFQMRSQVDLGEFLTDDLELQIMGFDSSVGQILLFAENEEGDLVIRGVPVSNLRAGRQPLWRKVEADGNLLLPEFVLDDPLRKVVWVLDRYGLLSCLQGFGGDPRHYARRADLSLSRLGDRRLKLSDWTGSHLAVDPISRRLLLTVPEEPSLWIFDADALLKGEKPEPVHVDLHKLIPVPPLLQRERGIPVWVHPVSGAIFLGDPYPRGSPEVYSLHVLPPVKELLERDGSRRPSSPLPLEISRSKDPDLFNALQIWGIRWGEENLFLFDRSSHTDSRGVWSPVPMPPAALASLREEGEYDPAQAPSRPAVIREPPPAPAWVSDFYRARARVGVWDLTAEIRTDYPVQLKVTFQRPGGSAEPVVQGVGLNRKLGFETVATTDHFWMEVLQAGPDRLTLAVLHADNALKSPRYVELEFAVSSAPELFLRSKRVRLLDAQGLTGLTMVPALEAPVTYDAVQGKVLLVGRIPDRAPSESAAGLEEEGRIRRQVGTFQGKPVEIDFPAGARIFSGVVSIADHGVGHFMVEVSEGNFHLGWIGLSPTWFRHPAMGVGIGTLVIKELMREAQSRGAKTFTSTITNPRLLRILYRSHLLQSAWIKDNRESARWEPWKDFYVQRKVESLPADQYSVSWDIRGEMVPLGGRQESGLEEEVEAARLRVRADMEALTKERPLRWQVLGPSVFSHPKYKALRALDSPLFPGIRVDPGELGTALLVNGLRDAGVAAVTYYGSDEEYRSFEGLASFAKIPSRPVQPGEVSFVTFLQQLLTNLAALTDEQLAGFVNVERLAADVELLEKA